MTRTSLVTLLLATASSTLAAHGQGLTESTITASITQRFEADSNYQLDDSSPGTTFFSDTRLGLDFTKETATQQFNLGANIGARLLWEADQPFDLTYADPAIARMRYSRDWADGNFNGYLRYAYRRLNGRLTPLDPGFIPVVPDDLTRFDGTENRFDGGFSLALRTDSPSSYTFRLDATNVSYSDLDPDRTGDAVPRNSVNGEIFWKLQLNPILSTGVVATYDYWQAENDTDNEIKTASIDAGFIYEPDETLNITAGIGYEDRTRRETILGDRRDTEHDTGPAVRGSIRYDIPDFTLDAQARVTTAASDTRWTGDFNVSYNLLRGDIFARGYRSYNGNSNGDESLNYGAGIGMNREINTISRWGIDVYAVNQIDQDDPSVADLDRIGAALRYTRDLTQDITTTIGYRLRLRTEDGSAQSNAVFFTIGRSFSRKP
jgi:hypothetical protein